MGNIIYRPHKGSLSEALSLAKEFETEREMKEHIFRDWKKYCEELGKSEPPFEIEDILIDGESFNDNRCGWHDTRYVCIKKFGKEIYDYPQCIGMCATDYEKPENNRRDF